MLQIVSWQFGGDSSAKKPDLITLPGLIDDTAGDGDLIRGKAISVEDARERLGW